MELDWSLGLINASPTHADFQICGWPGTKNAKCESPLFGELANRLSMFLIRSGPRRGRQQSSRLHCFAAEWQGAKKMIRAAHAKEKQ